jgi:ferredoxin
MAHGCGLRVRKLRGWERRTLLRVLGLGALASGLVAVCARVGKRGASRPAADLKVVITPTCVACLGCVAVCPTAAIEARPGRIRVIQSDCVSCGYCQSGCAVDGIRVVGEHDG